MRQFIKSGLGISLVFSSVMALAACPHSLLKGQWHGTWVNVPHQTSGQITQAYLTTCHHFHLVYQDQNKQQHTVELLVESVRGGGVSLENKALKVNIFTWRVAPQKLGMLGYVGQDQENITGELDR